MTNKTPTTYCPRCQNDRLIEQGHLRDGRPMLKVCYQCGGAGPVAEKPRCFVQRPVLKHETVLELDRIQRRARQQDQLWAAIPEHVQGALDRYFKRRIDPGYTLHSLLAGDTYEAGQNADTATKEAMVSICAWVAEFAPKESHGSEQAVTDFLNWRPKCWGVEARV